MGTSSLYKGPKSSVLLPSDFDTEAEEEEKLEGDSAGESDENTTGEEDTTEESYLTMRIRKMKNIRLLTLSNQLGEISQSPLVEAEQMLSQL